MYRMLIVDDEELITQGMKRAIERIELFSVETASNGIQAYDRICAGGIDGMLLDINMPDMNGIELMRRLQESGRNVVTAIISGYEEFDYATQAIRYGVSDYILKPVSPKDVAAIGLKIFEHLETKKIQQRRSEELQQFVMEQRSVIKQKMLSDILNGSVQRECLEEIRKLYGADLRGEYFTASLICIRRAQEGLGEMAFQITLREVEQEIERIFSDVPEAILFNMENARYVMLISSSVPFEPTLLEELLNQTADAIAAIEGVEAYIGKGEEVRGLDAVQDSYRSASEAIDYHSMFQNERVYVISDYRKNDRIIALQHMLTAMEVHLRRMQYDEAAGSINQIYDYIEENVQPFTQPQLMFVYNRMNCAMMSVMLENGLMTDFVMQEPRLNDRQPSTEELRSRALSLLGVLRREIFRSFSDKNRGISHRVADYIIENYADSGLSMNRISAEMNYSANYLGNAFKREYGESFNDFLNKTRVEAAKRLMNETDMRVYEIAFAVGFNDQHYFSKTFRRITGISPSEYRDAVEDVCKGKMKT